MLEYIVKGGNETMMKIEKTYKEGYRTRKLYFEKYDNFNEYLSILEDRDKNHYENSDHRLEYLAKNDPSFTGVSSWEQVKDLLVNGWKAQVETIKQSFKQDLYKLGTKKYSTRVYSQCGYQPCVPRAILGHPKSMYNNVQEQRKIRVIRFLIDIGVNCDVSTREMISKMTKVLARIASLEQQGIRCQIESMQNFSRDNSSQTAVAHTIRIKDASQPFDINRMAFPLAHSAMLRVLGFSWENSLPLRYDDYHECGLGRAMYRWDNNSKEAFLEAIKEKGEEVIYVGYKTDLDEVFGKFEKGGTE